LSRRRVVRLPRGLCATPAVFAVCDVRLDVREPLLNFGEARAQRREVVAVASAADAAFRARRVGEPSRDTLGQLPHPVLLAAAHR
jgi:hypothetical protein